MCDCAVAVGAAAARGSPIFAKNSDRESEEAQPVRKLERREHPTGAPVRCTYLEIPQVRETAAVLGSGPFWCWGLEHGVSEHGLVIGNEAVFTREELELPEQGLLGMDLVRLGLERCASAAEAVRTIGDLIERHGQGGKGWMHIDLGYSNGFLLADAREAWTLQTSSRRWAARRVRDLEAVTNQPSIGSDWDLASEDAESFALERGWWGRDRGRLDFESAYRSTRLFAAVGSEGRLRRNREALEAQRGRLAEREMFALLRDHGGALVPQPADKSDEAYYTICAHNEVQGDTAASLVVAQDRSTRWLSLTTPCTSVFLPLSVDGKVPGILERGGGEPSDDSAWWRFKRLQRATELDFAARLPRVREAFAPLEEAFLAEESSAGDPSARMEAATFRALEVADDLLRSFDS
jgi:dipeptidase